MYSLGLVLGGCCSNVYFLEILVRKHPHLGELLTFAQFLGITLASLGSFVPSRKWILPSLMYGVVCYLNNMVFAYKISVPVHTIVRSSGPIISMVIGSLMGKTYGRRKQLGVAIISVGVAVSAGGSDANSLGSPVGIAILVLATVLASIQGFVASSAASDWKQSLCMSHAYCLPFFALFSSDIKAQAQSLDPEDLVWLGANVLTQLVCAVGVNKLVTSKGPVALNVTLTVRKFVTLGLSALLFGGVAPQVLAGGALVGAGALVYG